MDIVVLATKKNTVTLKYMIPYLRVNVECKDILIVSPASIENDIRVIDGVWYVNEDEVLSGMTFNRIKELIVACNGNPKRTGWYFQQFLKLAWAYRCEDSCYLVMDADTFPLNEISFFESGKYLFTQKIEYNKPYFNTIDTLFNGSIHRLGDFSFVAEHMAFECSVVKEMLDEIVCRYGKDVPFYEAIIRSIKSEDLCFSGFSEFETYGTYFMTKYPDRGKMRKLRTLREAVYTLGSNPTKEQLEWAANDYDIVSIEVPDLKPSFFTWICSMSFIQRHFRYRSIAKLRAIIRTIYRKITGRRDFRYD